jgi:hypothetical protein
VDDSAVETFVLRVWIPAEINEPVAQPVGLRGFVEHVGSGRSDPFRGGDELLALVAAAVDSHLRGEGGGEVKA